MPTDRLEALESPPIAKERGVFSPEPGREGWRDPEYVRTTTGWLVRVVRLEVDFADLVLLADWKAGALRARMAADWSGGSVLVSVVAVLGTEPELAARSVGCSGASEVEGIQTAWASSLVCGAVALAAVQKLEKTPKATDWRVVVAGVKAGGSALESAAPAGGAEVCGSAGAWARPRLRAAFRFAADSDIMWIGFLELQQVNA